MPRFKNMLLVAGLLVAACFTLNASQAEACYGYGYGGYNYGCYRPVYRSYYQPCYRPVYRSYYRPYYGGFCY